MTTRFEGPDYSAIERDGYRATWEPVPFTTEASNGARVDVRMRWVIRYGQAFIAIADSPGEVGRLIRWASERGRRAA